MYSKLAVLASAVFATAALAANSPLGSANISNKCSKTVYLWSVFNDGDAAMHTIPAGGNYTEKFFVPANKGGISLKLATSPSQDEISQFEYTLVEPMVFYDLSNINGYPEAFVKGGITITPSDSSCPTINCAPGVSQCTEAYNHPKDDFATKGCQSSTSFQVDLCSGNSGSSSSSAVPSATATVANKRAVPFGVKAPLTTGAIHRHWHH